MLTAFGVAAAVTMVMSYALENRNRLWISVFAGGCLAAAIYGVMTGAWIFAGLESVWAVVATHRFRAARRRAFEADAAGGQVPVETESFDGERSEPFR